MQQQVRDLSEGRIASQFLNANNWPLGAALAVVLMTVVLGCLFLASRRFGLQQLFMGGRP